MKYHLRTSDVEWEIEPSESKSWILKRRTSDEWSVAGTFGSPTEAAVIAGARATSKSRGKERHTNRLQFVLSSWEVVASS